jgi:CHASE2 domain-containing sensor protein
MSTPCTVIIGAAELLDALRESAAADGDVLAFSDSDALKALDEITARQPSVIGLERLFAATSRGAALINRIKADPALMHAEVRVLSVDGTYRVSPRRTRARRMASAPTVQEPASATTDVVIETVAPPAAEAPAPAQNLDYRGTRRAPRFRMVEGTEMQVDGALAKIVDLSTHGAQILCPNPLKPQQKLRMVLADDLGNVKFSATVAWASFEIPKGVPRYRAGVEFIDAEPKAVEAFCRRHRIPPA